MASDLARPAPQRPPARDVGAHRAAVLRRRSGFPALALIPLIVLLIAAAPWAPRGAGAHAELERAVPPMDGLLAAPPERVELWLTEPVDAGTVAVRVLDETGRDAPVAAPLVDPVDPRHAVARVERIGPGTWTVRSAADGHTLSGTYAFRVGPARALGAATTDGESPRAWAVATRWLTFLGAALAAGGFLAARIHFVGDLPGGRPARRRAGAVVVGALAALLATLAEPAMQARWPPAGAVAPDLGRAVAALPAAWWLRPAALAPLLLLGLAALALARRDRALPSAAGWARLALALAALLGLSLTSHAAAREGWRAVTVAANVAHQWAVAFWVGGLAHLELAWPGGRAVAATPRGAVADPVRRFSRLALGLVAVGVGTGALNAGLVLPSVRALWQSAYGDLILLKVAALLPPLALATFNRAALHRAAGAAAPALRRAVRAEAALVLAVVLGGSALALSAPPARAGRGGGERLLDLAAPLALPALAAGEPAEDLRVHLRLRPVRAGENAAEVLLRRPDGAPWVPPAETLVRLAVGHLELPLDLPTARAVPTGPGAWAAGTARLSPEGWWRARVLVRVAGRADAEVPFYLLLPDPNLDGVGAVPIPPSAPAARAVYERGVAAYTALHRFRWTERVSDGKGGGLVAEHALSDGTDGRPVGYAARTDRFELVRVDEREWLGPAGGPWQERAAPPFVAREEADYEWVGATGFRLGRTEEAGGEPCQVVTFFVSGEETVRRQTPAWFAFWVGTETGRVHRLLMVSRAHYMAEEFGAFDDPLTIEPPISGGLPAATPAPGTAGVEATSPGATPLPEPPVGGAAVASPRLRRRA